MHSTNAVRGAVRTLLLLLAAAASGCATRQHIPVEVITTPDGASAVLTTTMEHAADWTVEAFRQSGLQLSEIEIDEGARRYVGTRGAVSVHAQLTLADDARTSVAVKAPATSPAGAELARRVLEKIVKKQD